MKRIPLSLLICFVLAVLGSTFFVSYFSEFRNASIFVFLSFFLTFLSYSRQKCTRSIKITSLCLGTMFSLSVVFGYSYDHLDSYSYIFKNFSSLLFSLFCIVALSGFTVCLISILLTNFIRATYYPSIKASQKQLYLFWGFTVFILILGSIPYLVLYYPGLNIFDTHDQILQYFGYSSYIGNGTFLSDHHPVLLTLIYGIFIKLGIALGDASLGQFIYSIVSLFSISLCFATALTRLCTHGMSIQTGMIISTFLAIWPVTATYAFNMCKDITIAPLIIIFSIFMIELHYSKGTCFKSFSYCAAFILCTVILLMMRKSAFPAIIITGILFVITYKPVRRQIAVSFSFILGIFLIYQSLFLPALHIVPGESREMFSIPFQQTARYLIHYPEDVTPSEKASISRVINLASINNYDPRLSDPVKDTSVSSADINDYLHYFKAWLSMGIRHPGVYLDAWFNMIYGYFYPSESNTILCLTLNSPNVAQLQLNHLDSLQPLRLKYYNFVYYTLRRIPLIGQLFFVPFITWSFLFFICVLFLRFGIPGMIPWTFFISTLGISLFSPKSGEIRYILPIVYALPLIFGVTITRKDENNNL